MICEKCEQGDHSSHDWKLGGIGIGCPCGFVAIPPDRPSPPAEPKCERCGGFGTIPANDDVGIPAMNCGNCNGTGRRPPATPEPAEEDLFVPPDPTAEYREGDIDKFFGCMAHTASAIDTEDAKALEDRAKHFWREETYAEELPHKRLARFAQAEIERQTPAIIERKQSDVWKWCEETFEGIAAWQTDKERAYRFFEEAGELFQAMGMDREDAIKVVDYVYGRPVGELAQEIGGVMVTLFALASQQNQSVSESFETEYERIIRPEIQAKIRNKQLAKNEAFL